MNTQTFKRKWEVEGNLEELIKLLSRIHSAEWFEGFKWSWKNDKRNFRFVKDSLAESGILASDRFHEKLKNYALNNFGYELDISKLKCISHGYIANATDSIALRMMEDPISYPAKLKIRLKYCNGMIRLDVEDNGKGIDKEIEPNIFSEDGFTTKGNLPESIKGVLSGRLGMDLAYAVDFSRELSGKVGFYNKGIDKGAIFWYKMPIESVIKQKQEEAI